MVYLIFKPPLKNNVNKFSSLLTSITHQKLSETKRHNTETSSRRRGFPVNVNGVRRSPIGKIERSFTKKNSASVPHQ